MTNTSGKHQRVGGVLQGLRHQVALSPRAHRELVVPASALAALTVIERAAPAVTGLVLIGWGPYQAAASAVGAVGLSLFRAGIERRARMRFQSTFVAEVAHTIAGRSAIAEASADRVQAGAFGAMHSASTLAVSRLPTLAGDLVAAALIGPFLLWQLDPWMIAVVTPCLIAAALVGWILRRATISANERTYQSARALIDQLATLLRGRLELVAQGKAQRVASQVQDTAEEWSRATVGAERMAAMAGRAPIAVLVASVGLIAWFWLKDMPSAWTNTAGRALMLGTGLAIVGSLARSAAELGRVPHDIVSLAALAGLEPDSASPKDARAFDPEAVVEFESVEFTYDAERAPVIRELSLSWGKGELVGLAGANGSGKSTLLRLLTRVADPQRGAILIGGVDLREVDLTAWRESISFLPQRPFLPERGTVAEALRWTGDQDTEDAASMLRKLGLLDRLQSSICDLSMGERQKVALARVLGSRKPMLLLDEPDSWLDAQAIEALGRILREQAHWRRVLMVAHDPRLLAFADRVVTLGSERTLQVVASA